MFEPSRLLTDDDIDRLEAAAMRILSEAGMRFESDRLLSILETNGARVDPSRHRAFFDEDMLRRVLELVKPPSEQREVSSLISREMGQEYTVDFGYEAFFLYDWQLKDRRRAGEDDIVELLKLGEMIPEVTCVGLPVLNSNTDQRIEALEIIPLQLRHTTKHRGAGVRTPEQVRWMVEIDRLLGYTAETPHFVQPGRCMISPLSFGSDACGIFEALLDHRYDRLFWVATMPIAGGTGPVTVAGTALLQIAEIIGGWVLAKSINPQAEVNATVISGTMDMREVSAAFASPEAMLQDIAAVEFFRRRYGIKVGFDPGYIDAKVPGLQVAFEKAFKQTAFGLALAPALTVGGLEGCATFSPTLAMVEIELNKGIHRFLRGASFDDASLAVDEIITLCNADGKSFLQTDHTLQNWREALWQPHYITRGLWRDGETEWRDANAIFDGADEKWRALVQTYEPPDVDEDMIREVEAVVERARMDLCG